MAGGASVARADVPPDLSGSSLVCSDADGGAFRAGDDLKCDLVASIAFGTDDATITGKVTLPSTVEPDPAHPLPQYDAATRLVTFGPTVLGLTFSGQQRLLTFYVQLVNGLDPGTAVALTVDLTATATSVTTKSVSSAPVFVSPPAADLEATTLTCSDANGGALMPGDQVACSLDVVNAAGHEDASSVGASISFPGGTWVSGGLVIGTGVTFFNLGTVASGSNRIPSAVFAVSPQALGGSTLTAVASIFGTSTPSGDALSVVRLSDPLTVAAGPAQLTASSLRCDDTSGGLLLAGDDLTCALVVAPTLGYESIQGTTATVTIPPGAEWVSGGDSHDATSVSFDTSSLGDIAAGATKGQTFHLRVADGTPVNTVLHPTGSISATSVPLGGPIQQALSGNLLSVGKVVAPPGQAAPDEPPPVVTPPPVKPPVVVSTAYKLRAKTIKFVMRHGHRRGNHLWKGSKRRFAFVKKFVVRTPKISGKVVKRVTVPKKGKWAPKRGKVKIKGTRLTYTLKKGVNPAKVKDRFHYTITDTHGKKATGRVIVTHN